MDISWMEHCNNKILNDFYIFENLNREHKHINDLIWATKVSSEGMSELYRLAKLGYDTEMARGDD